MKYLQKTYGIFWDGGSGGVIFWKIQYVFCRYFMKASLSQQLFVLPAYFLTSIIEEWIQDRIYKESNYVKSQITKVHLFMTNKGKVIRI